MDGSVQRFGGLVAGAVTLGHHRQLFVRQRFELGEMFGFETRNRYEVVSESGAQVAFAAEQQKGFLGFLFRQSLGHWRTFDIRFFTPDRVPFMTARHPFRWFFQRLEVYDEAGALVGAIQRRFSILTKRFDVRTRAARVMEVRRRSGGCGPSRSRRAGRGRMRAARNGRACSRRRSPTRTTSRSISARARWARTNADWCSPPRFLST